MSNSLEFLNIRKSYVIAENGILPALDGSLLINLPVASGGNITSTVQSANYATSAGYAQEVGKHNHSAVQITDFDSSVSSIVSIMIEDIDVNNAQFASSANYANSADVAEYASSAGYAQEVGQHNHSAVQITDFNSNVSSIVSSIIATSDSLGLVKIGSGLEVDEFGSIKAKKQINELIFKVPQIESNDEVYHLNIEFSNSDTFDSVISYITLSDVSGFKVFTGMAMINFPSQGLGMQFSEEQVKFDISNINYKYYRYQWIAVNEGSSSVQNGRYGYGQTDGVLNLFDIQSVVPDIPTANTYNDFNRIVVSQNTIISNNDFAIVDTDCNITLPVCSAGMKVAVGATQEADNILIIPASGNVIIKNKTTSSTEGILIDKEYGYVELFGTSSGWKIARLS